ncbi:HXXEE domain-containing protein [Sporolactobacillus laevolacticus]|uniref:HXXEE domain-containing protein n=1 Tax=Sporolactobacillus laevolacticus TaxID=33018 RepID=UPI0025B571F4|nr:HXXEE domain-containing protein [Sporolactobacillus laevolacticus]MDN3954639.1 HXXEE domain-containing protein [Sporolactobacillus laevolacticus]
MSPSLLLLFLFAFLIHNVEEGIWLMRASAQQSKINTHQHTSQDQFLFAVIFVTAVALLITALYIFYPNQWLLKYAFFGYLGAMILNIFLVHLSSTIIERRYSPGLMTGFLALLPVNGMIIIRGFHLGIVSFVGMLAATIVMSVVLLLFIPIMFKIAAKLITY